MNKIAIYGCGGHAKVIADILRAIGTYQTACYYDASPKSQMVDGVPVFSSTAAFKDFISAQQVKLAVIAIGNNHVRKKYYAEAADLGLSLPAIIHPTSIISSSAILGDGTVVMPAVVVNAYATIGEGVILNTGAIIEHDCTIGSFAHIAPGSVLCGGVSIGELTLIGARSVATPLKKIGANSTVGAGSVVVRDIPDFANAYGCPAKPVKLGPQN